MIYIYKTGLFTALVGWICLWPNLGVTQSVMKVVPEKAPKEVHEEVLQTVIVEAPEVETSAGDTTPDHAAVAVPSGVGSQLIDAPLNEFGVELKSMERQEDISLGRRSEGWWLNPEATPKRSRRWVTQMHGDFSTDQKLRARILGRVGNGDLTVEGGTSRDYREMPYIDNHRTPYNPADDSVGYFQNRKQGGFGRIRFKANTTAALADFDQNLENVQAGPTTLGNKSQVQGSLNAKWASQNHWELTPFLQVQNNHFDSQMNALSSNATKGLRGGLQVSYRPVPLLMLQTSLSQEKMTRVFSDQSQTKFDRNYVKTLGQVSWLSNRWIEMTTHAFAEAARDHIHASGAATAGGSDPEAQTLLWDAGIDVSTSHRFYWGLEARMRRYSLMPTPTQRFGDGSLVQGSASLPAQTGVRLSAGPWWNSERLSLGLNAFSEQARNAPLLVAVSPTSVRTLPLGGVWVRGVELSGVLKVGRFEIAPSYVYQEAVNDSEVNWQRGQNIPGRPRSTLKSEGRFNYEGFKLGIVHRFESEDAIDLGGLWVRPAQHQVDTFVGYGRKSWELRLALNNLIQNWRLPQNPDFQGSAGPNLLEPAIPQREVRLLCEVLL